MGILVVIVLGVGGCSFWFFRAVSGPADTGNEFLAALDERDYERASALSDPDCFDRSDAAFYQELFGDFEVESYNLTSSSFNDPANAPRQGETSGTITFAGERPRNIELALVDKDGWLICGFDIGDPGSGS